MKLSEKVRLLLTNPGMPHAYLNWWLHRLGGRKPRRIVDSASPSVSVGEWISFSEYWSYHDCPSPSERRFILGQLGRDVSKTAFDIGANVGLFTCWLGGLRHKVHSFEPIPETFCRLAANVRYNGLLKNVSLYCMAVGEQRGIAQFEVRDDAPGLNRIATRATESLRSVPCTTIDEHAKASGVSRIDFLKMDVEGMEPTVIKGASHMMRSTAIGAMLVEVCPGNLYHAGMSPLLLHQAIVGNGYLAYAVDADGQASARLSATEFEAMDSENIAVLPKP